MTMTLVRVDSRARHVHEREPCQLLDGLLEVRLPAALPAFASGMKVAASVAPIGAVVGEWVGTPNGLGRVMLDANQRIQTDLMFAALFLLALIAVLVYLAVDRLGQRMVTWQRESD